LLTRGILAPQNRQNLVDLGSARVWGCTIGVTGKAVVGCQFGLVSILPLPPRLGILEGRSSSSCAMLRKIIGQSSDLSRLIHLWV
jgi:hypothetical protein